VHAEQCLLLQALIVAIASVVAIGSLGPSLASETAVDIASGCKLWVWPALADPAFVVSSRFGLTTVGMVSLKKSCWSILLNTLDGGSSTDWCTFGSCRREHSLWIRLSSDLVSWMPTFTHELEFRSSFASST